jgi:NAD(P)-dependent dehydrogenase (short-subunit alcohol dehydrogenase family)
MAMALDLTGKVGIITGAGIAEGIGTSAALLLGAAGARLVLADLPGVAIQNTVAELAKQGIEAAACPVDIADEASVAALMEFTQKTYSRLDFLVNNAASVGNPTDTDVMSMDVGLWDKIMNINARGTMLMCKHALALMIPNGGGSIVNISSGTSLQGDFFATAYGTSKGAINTFTKYVATQYGPQGVRCNAVAPGLIMTHKLASTMPLPMQEIFRQHCLTTQLGQPADIANAVLFLVSDQSKFLTGQVISVDGGFTAHAPTTVDVTKLFAPS